MLTRSSVRYVLGLDLSPALTGMALLSVGGGVNRVVRVSAVATAADKELWERIEIVCKAIDPFLVRCVELRAPWCVAIEHGFSGPNKWVGIQQAELVGAVAMHARRYLPWESIIRVAPLQSRIAVGVPPRKGRKPKEVKLEVIAAVVDLVGESWMDGLTRQVDREAIADAIAVGLAGSVLR